MSDDTVLNRLNVVIFSGAGVSAESGLKTFRDSGGLWDNFAIEDVATPAGWAKNPKLVLDFYNDRRRQACAAVPNSAHTALVELEQKYNVTVITQNVDDLHERAGSSQVVHLHGELVKVRSCGFPDRIYTIGNKSIRLGDTCELGAQLRPHIVWFGEAVEYYDECAEILAQAHKVLVIGTSLSVFPAAGLLREVHSEAEKILIALEADSVPYGYQFIKAKATKAVPEVVCRWMAN